MKKYELTNETIIHDGRILYRIKRLSDGYLGGYVESEQNLSQEGDCFIHEQAKVYGEAKVSGKAWVYGEAKVSGKAQVYGEARVSGKAQVYGEAWVYGEAKVSGEARVYGEACVTNLAQTIITHKYGITLTDTHVIIGCESHTIKYWSKNIVDIGKKHGYTDKEIRAVKHMIRGMLLMREGK